MSLSSYSGIQAAVASWMNRADLTANIPDFITLAESRMNRLLADNANLVASTNITFTDANRTLPDDFMGVVSLVYDTPQGGALRFMPNRDFFDMQAGGYGGTPSYFTVSDGQIYIYPGPSAEGLQLRLRYRQKIDALNLGPNWLLENHPDAYLFGALVEASAFMVEDDRGAMWKSRFDETIAEINKEGLANSFGGPLQIKSCGGE